MTMYLEISAQCSESCPINLIKVSLVERSKARSVQFIKVPLVRPGSDSIQHSQDSAECPVKALKLSPMRIDQSKEISNSFHDSKVDSIIAY